MIFLFSKKDKNKCPKIKTKKKSWKKFTIFYNNLFKVLKEIGLFKVRFWCYLFVYLHAELVGIGFIR